MAEREWSATHRLVLPSKKRQKICRKMVNKVGDGHRVHLNLPSFICVDETWHDCAHVCAGANEEDDD